jgi:hypothetical protein
MTGILLRHSNDPMCMLLSDWLCCIILPVLAKYGMLILKCWLRKKMLQEITKFGQCASLKKIEP